MLVLSRKVGQKIMVPGCEMTISVVKVNSNRVYLGIAAPQEVAVHREEVYRRIQEEDVGKSARDASEAA